VAAPSPSESGPSTLTIQGSISEFCQPDQSCAYYAELESSEASSLRTELLPSLELPGGPVQLEPGEYVLALSSFALTFDVDPPRQTLDAVCTIPLAVPETRVELVATGTFTASTCEIFVEDVATVGQCPGQTWPPYGGIGSAPSITIRAIDTQTTEIRNGQDRKLYFLVSRWPTSRLVCGIGRTEQQGFYGFVAAGETITVDEGSTPETPMTISIWEAPCGEGGCNGLPVGVYEVPISPIVHRPVATD
jgi:hypothetical protein